MYWPRGRVLGGSLSLNAMVYIRGHALDYDRWSNQEGASGWSYEDCLPYFKHTERRESGGNQYRGDSGHLGVWTGNTPNPLFDAFIEAGSQAGYPLSEDLNGEQQEGFCRMDLTVSGGERCSASKAWLRPLPSDSLDIKTNTMVTRLIFDKKQCIGARTVNRLQPNGETDIHANEVILCGGAINSPQILLLSGIGDRKHLDDVGIRTLVNSPGVGANLQDHLEIYVQQKCTKPITLYTAQQYLPMAKLGIQWFLSKNGLCSTSHLEAGAFIRSRCGIPHPNIQFHFLPSLVVDHGRIPGSCHGYQAHVGPMRPTSVGSIRLKSQNPFEHPIIQPNYLQTENDREEMRDAVKLTREIFAQSAFDDFRGDEIAPGESVRSDEELDEFIRQKADSAYHPSCSCKMGNDDQSVVDPSTMRVHGIDGLRIVDASVMPSIISGNLNAPVLMMAEKASDMILGQTPLSPAKGISVKVFDTRTQRPNSRMSALQ
uniref:Choline dehydrogenase n=2 Tax=Hirondellea gigas TaxID=1518452 RepID=A0A6A7G1E1_9CRUS